jgi:hypothetical protein
MAEPGSPAEVLIVGGGVAAVETLLALRDLAADRVRIQLVAPEPDFVFRPMSVAEPFGLGQPRRYALRRIVEEVGAGLVQAGVAAVQAALRRVVLRSAAGDATSFQVKQGGLAAQQADAVAEHVAARQGAEVEPSPFRPVLRGLLFTGGPQRYLRAAEPGGGAAAAHALWCPPTKIVGRYLAPYLYEREPGAEPGPAPEGFADLAVPLVAAEVAPMGR